jgi:hypothetical protein
VLPTFQLLARNCITATYTQKGIPVADIYIINLDCTLIGFRAFKVAAAAQELRNYYTA